jgi:hypothetical protein
MPCTIISSPARASPHKSIVQRRVRRKVLVREGLKERSRSSQVPFSVGVFRAVLYSQLSSNLSSDAPY